MTKPSKSIDELENLFGFKKYSFKNIFGLKKHFLKNNYKGLVKYINSHDGVEYQNGADGPTINVQDGNDITSWIGFQFKYIETISKLMDSHYVNVKIRRVKDNIQYNLTEKKVCNLDSKLEINDHPINLDFIFGSVGKVKKVDYNTQ